MKNKIFHFQRDCWQLLTEVPGWPDAPRQVRLRRALPLVFPCVALLLLLLWNRTVRDTHVAHERAQHQALVEQDKEIDALRLGYSDQQVGELTARAESVSHIILNDPKELTPVLQALKREAKARGWEANFQATDLSTDAEAPATPLIFLLARGKLTAIPGNAEAFSSLLNLVEHFSATEKRIDLTHLAIRADEQGRYSAEINFRLVCRSPNEKTL